MPCHFGHTAVQKCIEEQPVTMTLLTWLNQTGVAILVLQPL